LLLSVDRDFESEIMDIFLNVLSVEEVTGYFHTFVGSRVGVVDSLIIA
jgi:hypothetical protein